MVNTEPQITNNAGQHRYDMTVDGKPAGHIAWRMHGDDTIDLVHTEVAGEYEGRGLASKIAKFALDDARKRGLKVLPTCSYIAGWIRKHPDYEDLVAQR
jgi:uncharacterized protein